MKTYLRSQIIQAVEVLNRGGSLLYPTDTVWGLGCDATNETAVKKIFEIKERALNKSMILLVDSLEMLQNYVEEIPPYIKEYLQSVTEPTSVIYPNPKEIAPLVIAQDNTIAIRIVKEPFCQSLIKELGKPLVSTSANISGNTTPKCFSEIDKKLLQKVDFIIDYKREEKSNGKSSRLIRWVNGELEILR